jgi:hypothetical protein
MQQSRDWARALPVLYPVLSVLGVAAALAVLLIVTGVI